MRRVFIYCLLSFITSSCTEATNNFKAEDYFPKTQKDYLRYYVLTKDTLKTVFKYKESENALIEICETAVGNPSAFYYKYEDDRITIYSYSVGSGTWGIGELFLSNPIKLNESYNKKQDYKNNYVYKQIDKLEEFNGIRDCIEIQEFFYDNETKESKLICSNIYAKGIGSIAACVYRDGERKIVWIRKES
ncbi:MAG: hypothetical protein A2096_12280 [Spirochaetes bacterium GWF1_41_5]|nr:MAG: hypothetical protein A2096_12280 [Spirochaetes bacterium GWF1_41_5]HBE01769.1 hypothetical protein [Spirochaetia bacterium]